MYVPDFSLLLVLADDQSVLDPLVPGSLVFGQIEPAKKKKKSNASVGPSGGGGVRVTPLVAGCAVWRKTYLVVCIRWSPYCRGGGGDGGGAVGMCISHLQWRRL